MRMNCVGERNTVCNYFGILIDAFQPLSILPFSSPFVRKFAVVLEVIVPIISIKMNA